LLVGLLDLRPLHGDLRIEVLHRRLGLPDLRGGLIDGGLIVTRVDFCQQISGLHELVVCDIDLHDVARDLRADEHRPAVNERIVRALIVPGIQVPQRAANRAGYNQPEANDHRDRMVSNRPCKSTRPRLLLLLICTLRVFAIGFARLTLRTDVKPIANRLLFSLAIGGLAAALAPGRPIKGVGVASVSGTHKASQSIHENRGEEPQKS
jgi:hypothetical protein